MPSPDSPPGRALARRLGLFSLGLGAVQLLAPDELSRRIGLDDDETTRTVMRAIGVRELAVVPGLLAGTATAPWLWARVGGDALDLALLGSTLDGTRGRARRLRQYALGAVAGVAALDLLAAMRAPRGTHLHLTAAVTVAKPADELYRFWRDLENLPTFMAHLEQVREGPDGRSRWTARAPLGTRVAWDAETVEDVPGERLSWRSVGRTLVPNSGTVEFTAAPGDRGTEVRVDLTYTVPAGRAGAAFARLLGEDPHQQVEDDLRRLKQVVETGDVVRSDGTPGGTFARRHTVQRPAAPARH